MNEKEEFINHWVNTLLNEHKKMIQQTPTYWSIRESCEVWAVIISRFRTESTIYKNSVKNIAIAKLHDDRIRGR